jgi:hypothetical protein
VPATRLVAMKALEKRGRVGSRIKSAQVKAVSALDSIEKLFRLGQ